MAKHDATPSPVNVGARGLIHGDISVTKNVPFPTQNCSHGSGRMNGLVLHTEVGFDRNVVREFNNRSAGASAFFSVDFAGHVHQYIPVGQGYYSWAQVAGNPNWYSVECEDGGDPNRPLTDTQIIALAQLFECLSHFAGFPLRITDNPDGAGLGVHNMGGADWGGHTCPDLPPRHVRSHQRPAIMALAQAIRQQRKDA